jgi:D-glycero-D-manno-heptose 1,7-bisphosphate phosphatase
VRARPAAFLDRDGTIIVDTVHVARPDQVELLPGAARAIARLNAAKIPVIVVTNQSGIAQGRFTEQDYEAVREQLADLLAEENAYIDASYHCPHYPAVTGPCECRKPGRLLYERAITEHTLDPGHSFFVGDRARDVLPGAHFGGRNFFIPSSSSTPEDMSVASGIAQTVDSLASAVDLILGSY